MKIYLMRHGQTTGDIEDRYGGDYDDHLTELGLKQAREMSRKIKDYKIEKIFYSPRIRAIETAQICKKITSAVIESENDLRERNAYGILTGMIKTEAEKNFSKLVEELKNPKATIEGAENYDDFKKRVIGVFEKLTKNNFATVGIITHGGVISCFLREIIGRERKRLNDCAIIELDNDNDKFSIVNMNGVELE